MDAGENFAALPRQSRTHRVELRIAQDLARDGFAREAVHHIAVARAVLRVST